MSAAVVIRSAHPEDAPALAALLVELGYPDNTPGDVRERIDAWSATRDAATLVAELDGRIVGTAGVAAIPYLERRGRFGRIVTLVVAGDVRRRGVARALVARAEAIALGWGCVVMEVTSARNRSASHAFYRSLGYHDWCDRSARYLKDLVPGALAGSYGARR